MRSTAAASGFASVRAAALAALETSLREPGETGLSARLDAFWASWEDLANRPGDPAAEAVVLEGATAVVSAITAGYQEVVDQWARGLSALDGLVSDLNTAAAQVADLNARIRSTAAAGGSVNELVDQRAAVAATLAALGGGEVRHRDDGTVDVLIGGNPIVQGTSVNRLVVTGAARVQDAAADPVQVEWAHRPGTPAGVGDGEIAAHVSLLAPAQPAGTGGVLAEAAATYDALAADLAAAVNAVHTTGTTTSGAPAGDVFGFTPGCPPLRGCASSSRPAGSPPRLRVPGRSTARSRTRSRRSGVAPGRPARCGPPSSRRPAPRLAPRTTGRTWRRCRRGPPSTCSSAPPVSTSTRRR